MSGALHIRNSGDADLCPGTPQERDGGQETRGSPQAKSGGVASSGSRGRRARSGKEAVKQAAGAAGAVTTRACLPTTFESTPGPSAPHGETQQRGTDPPTAGRGTQPERRDCVSQKQNGAANTTGVHHRRQRSATTQMPKPTKTNPQTSPPSNESTTMSDKDHSTTMDRILQEITTVSRRIEGMDASITLLTLETKSMRSDIAGFQSRVTGLEQHMGSLETQVNMSQEREQDFLYLRSKLTDMEDRSRRENIRLLGVPENEEGSDMQAFLSSTLPKMTLLDFDPPLEFQRAHRTGPKRSDNSSRPRPIIVCLLRHNQTRQILQVARTHGPFRIDQHEIRITADYSKETNERRKAFLALRPQLLQLETKYSLFDPARMWVTKNGVSEDFYKPDELRLFLDSFQSQPMDSISTDCMHGIVGDSEGAGTLHLGKEKTNTALYDSGASHRGRDIERLVRSYDDRGQVLHTVVTHTQLSERDKSRSPLKPTTGSS
ncbi:hypothetical protein NDU88_002914 [Pleurodeles waltl]|uniref:Uncharacterized protein n=1 Tax=Pleurodeles waltl TaxID=8319 RepID=A0AAV7LFG8_PLEWA|nr:hypothetical protein NDU88_002914 [Pleurodeles waltl]